MFNLNHSLPVGVDPLKFLKSIRTIIVSLQAINQYPFNAESSAILYMNSLTELINTKALLKTLWLELLALEDQALSPPLDEAISAETLNLDELYSAQLLSDLLVQGMTQLSDGLGQFPANWQIKNRKYGLLLKRIYYDLWEINFQFKRIQDLIQSQSVLIIFEKYCRDLDQPNDIKTIKLEFLVLLEELGLHALKPQIQAIPVPSLMNFLDQIADIRKIESELSENSNIPSERFLDEGFQIYRELGSLYRIIYQYATAPANQIPLGSIKENMLKKMVYLLDNKIPIDAEKFHQSPEYQFTLLYQALETCKSALAWLATVHQDSFLNEALMDNFQQRHPHDRADIKLFFYFCTGNKPYYQAIVHQFDTFDRNKHLQLEQLVRRQAEEIQILQRDKERLDQIELLVQQQAAEIEYLKRQVTPPARARLTQRILVSRNGIPSSRSNSVSPVPLNSALIGQSVFTPKPPATPRTNYTEQITQRRGRLTQ